MKLLNHALFFYILLPSCIRAAEINPAAFSNKVNSAAFEENLGQIKYPDNKPAPEVKYVFKQGNLKIFLLKTGLAYQLEKYEQDTNQVTQLSESASVDSESFFNNTIPKRIQTYRMDMQLIGANPNPEIITEGKSEDYTNYYKPDLIQTHNYRKIIYKNIYPGIDWVIYLSPLRHSELALLHSELDSESVNRSTGILKQVQHDYTKKTLYDAAGSIKYDFIVHPGADPALIKLKYKNAELIYLDKDGNLILRNRLGDIKENAPIAFQENENIPLKFLLKDSIVAFDIKQYDTNRILVIDPKLDWSTYYGGVLDDVSFGSTIDYSSNVFIFGQTNSSTNISYNGFQDTLINVTNAFVAKFNPQGQRLWSTYYGTQNSFRGACTDKNNNICLVGHVQSSSTNISFNGHQNSHNGGTNDGLLVKFNAQGQRIWASYYGGMGADQIWDCAIDSTNSIIIYGQTTSQSNISHNGHQNNFYLNPFPNGSYPPNAFLVKFNEHGVRLWGSYFGINGSNYSKIALDYSNNIFISGGSNDDKLILNANTTIFGAFHFLAKFMPSGSFIFSKKIGLNSAFGGILDNHLCFNKNKLYFSIAPTSMINPPNLTTGFKTAVTGPNDILFVHLDTLGNQQWASYLGGSDRERTPCITIDKHQNRYIAAHTISPSGIYIKGLDSSLSGGNDLFVIKISKSDSVIWSSYFGGDNIENYPFILSDSKDNIYLSGTTRSPNGISHNGHQNTLGGLYDAFMLKISCSHYDTIRDTICSGDTLLYRSRKYTQAGFYTDSFLTWDICDSFISLHLTILRKDTTYLYDTICSGTSYVWNGVNRAVSGVYRDSLINTVGCDSFIILNLVVKRTDTTHLYDTLCANLPTFNNQNLTTAGIYRDTLTNFVGCDSHIFYHFIPKPIYETPLSRAICEGDSSLFGGKYYKQGGVYYDTLKTVNGCDSVLKLTLTVYPLDTYRQTQSICRGKSYNFYSQVLTSQGTYSRKFTNRNGCDSLILLTLALKDTSSYSLTRTICKNQFYSFNNQNLNTAGIYRDTLTNAGGCDSFITLTLLTNGTVSNTIEIIRCHGDIYQGYTQSGTYVQTLTSHLGCDSLLTIKLTYLPATEYKTISHSKCGAFIYGSRTYTQNDSFTETIKNYLLCDSIVTKHLVFITEPQPKFLADKTIEFCEEIMHKGQLKTTSFFTHDTIKSIEFPYCDSLYQPYYYRRENRPILSSITKQIDTVIKGETTNIQVSGAQNYRWSTGEQSPTIRPQITEDKTFEVTTWNLADCEEKMQFSIYVIDQPLIDFPTAFSPNGDGLNDYFSPDLSGNISIDYFQVFNRWGEKVYEHSSLSKGWDGSYQSKPAANGLYTYTLRFSYLGRSFTRSGEVMMVR